MRLEDTLATGAATAAVSGDMRAFGSELSYLVQKAEIDVATASGSADVHVQLEHLVTFYNTLSGLHTQLSQQIEAVQSTVSALGSVSAGGKVSGVKNAWAAMKKSAGDGQVPSSMVANLLQVDSLVLQHMDALHHNAQQYAQQENLAISALGRAAGTDGATSTSPDRQSRPASGATISNTSGLGSK